MAPSAPGSGLAFASPVSVHSFSSSGIADFGRQDTCPWAVAAGGVRTPPSNGVRGQAGCGPLLWFSVGAASSRVSSRRQAMAPSWTSRTRTVRVTSKTGDTWPFQTVTAILIEADPRWTDDLYGKACATLAFRQIGDPIMFWENELHDRQGGKRQSVMAHKGDLIAFAGAL